MKSVWLALAPALGLAACEGPFVPPSVRNPPPPPVAAIQITPDSTAVIAGDTAFLTATLRDSTGSVLTGRSVSWQTSDSSVAIVSPAGVVVTFNAGSVRISASAEGRSSSVPVVVQPLLLVGVATGGIHTCAAANNGHAYCWGDNTAGQVGDGTGSLIEPLPHAAIAAARFDVAAAGTLHSCALTPTGAAYCWGRNTEGELGRGSAPGDNTIPAPVLTSLTFSAIAAGGAHSCALSSAIAYCWGLNSAGQLGDNSTMMQLTPTRALAEVSLTTIVAGVNHTCALSSAGPVYCWGQNTLGQVGDSTQTERHAPTAVVGGLTFSSLSAGGNHTCALTASGTAYCWGSNTRRELGAGLPDTAVSAPAAVTGALSFTLITAGGAHTCGLTADGLAYCWGDNDSGQLGDSSSTERAVPTAVYGATRFATLEAGGNHTCGSTAARVVYCWGDGLRGQLGRGVQQSSLVPVKVLGP